MTGTPKPFPKPSGALLEFPRRRREPTQEIDLRPTSRHEIVIGGPNQDPPTVEQEIDITLMQEDRDPLSSLPEVEYDAQAVIRNETQPSGARFYEILTGFAVELALDHNGDAVADQRDLGPGDIIGLTGYTRVRSRTVITLRLYDMDKLAGDKLEPVVMRRLMNASINATTHNRNTIVQLRDELKGAEQANQDVVMQKSALQTQYDELGRLTTEKLQELKERFVAPLKQQLREREAELEDVNVILPVLREEVDILGQTIARLQQEKREIEPLEAENSHLKEWLEMFFKYDVPELLAENARLYKDRKVDAQSLTLMLDDFDDFVDQGVLDASGKRVAEVVSIIEPIITLASCCGDMELMQKALVAMGELHTFKMRMKKPPKSRRPPAT